MRYVAFLRAINVGGRRVVRMQALKEAFESLPVANVQTFIASGNVIFDASLRDVAAFERKAEARLREVFGFDIDTFVRSLDELRGIAECRPYHDVAANGEGGTVYVGFLREAPAPASKRKLRTVCTDVDEFCVSNREVLWLHRHTPQPREAGPPLEKVLGLRATFRNSRTVRKIAEKYSSK